MDDRPQTGPDSGLDGRRSLPIRRAVAWLIVFAALVASAALIHFRAQIKSSIEHDEGITFIQAAPAMAEWVDIAENHVAPAGTWAPAAQWQSFLEIREPLAFEAIGHGLAQWDIHPPVYFWVLHAWSLLFGMSPASSIWLNILIAVVTGLLLFGLGAWALRDSLSAAAVVGFWALAANTVGVSLIARQYGLLALFTVATVWASLALFGSQHKPRITAVLVTAALLALGVGTHYHFAILIAGLAMWLTITGWRRWRVLVAWYGTAALGFGLFLIMHPGLWSALATVESPSFDSGGSVLQRLKLTVTTVFGFFTSPQLAGSLVARFASPTALMIALAGFALVVSSLLVWNLHWKTPAAPSTESERAARNLGAVSSIGLWVLAVIVVLFLTGRSPSHAMGDRYLAMAWPLLAFFPMLLFRRVGSSLASVLVLALAMVSVPGQVAAAAAGPTVPTMPALLAPAKHVVIDTLARGVLPRVVIDAAPDAMVFAGTQTQILSDVDEWADELRPGDYVLSSSRYIEDPANKDLIRAELKQRFTFDKTDGPWPLTWWRITGVK